MMKERPIKLILLPGLDGTGKLFAPFLAEEPPGFESQVIPLPQDGPQDYDALENQIKQSLPEQGRMILLGESFSGPLALRVAAEASEKISAVVLCASFIRSPVPFWLRGIHRSKWIFRMRLPSFLIQSILTGSRRSLASTVRAALPGVPSHVLASRVRCLARLDEREALMACKAPILYLQGSRDRLIKPEHGREIASLHPRTTLRTLDGPHLLLQAAPRKAWQCIEDFIEKEGLPDHN